MAKKKDSQLEQISARVHDAWVSWAQQIQRRVKPIWRERWKKLYTHYDNLPEVEKEKDREFGRDIQEVIKKDAQLGGQASARKSTRQRNWRRQIGQRAAHHHISNRSEHASKDDGYGMRKKSAAWQLGYQHGV